MADASVPEITSREHAKSSGAQYYFTGKPCPRGHIGYRRTSNCACLECEVIKQARRAETLEWKKYKASWESNDRLDDPEKYRARKRSSYRKHRQRVLAQVKKYQTENNAKVCEQKRLRYHSQTPEQKRRALLKREYGLTPEEYECLYQQQDGACAICGKQGDLLCVDHCHDSKKIRGLLCRNCNHGIGQFKDDAGLLEKAIAYLKQK